MSSDNAAVASDTRPSPVAIEVENISKCYRIYRRPIDRLKQMLWGRHLRDGYGHQFWALKGVTFCVRRGETVGIIGRNGSGKSTLLQVIAGTLNASSGAAEVSGRVAALLELGSGLNPEETGRQNIFIYAAILGLTSEEISNRFADILQFADIGTFIDQPVKTYSSGMVVRLAFAVAINIDPDILIVDEALSVGDEVFSRKCFDRIRKFQEKGGTLLFVSHAPSSVVELCDRAILIDAGECLADGPPKVVIGLYQRLAHAPNERRDEVKAEIIAGEWSAKRGTDRNTSMRRQRPAEVVATQVAGGETECDDWFDEGMAPQSTIHYVNRGAEIHDARIESITGRKVNCLTHGREYIYRYRVSASAPIKSARFGMLIKTVSGLELAGASTGSSRERLPDVGQGGAAEVSFRWRCSLMPGSYFLNAGVSGEVEGERHFLARSLDLIMIRVLPEPTLRATALVNLLVDANAVIQYDGASPGSGKDARK